MPRPHLSKEVRCLLRKPKKLFPTSPTSPNLPASKSCKILSARALLLETAPTSSFLHGNKYSSRLTRFHGVWDKNDVYCLNRPSIIRLAVLKPSMTLSAFPPHDRNKRNADTAAASPSMEIDCNSRTNGSGPEIENSINLLPDHLHW